jgi:hypothetical protein
MTCPFPSVQKWQDLFKLLCGHFSLRCASSNTAKRLLIQASLRRKIMGNQAAVDLLVVVCQ